MNERSPFSLYIWASVDSMKAEAEPMRAMSHIQNIAPGPPKARAVATPAKMLEKKKLNFLGSRL